LYSRASSGKEKERRLIDMGMGWARARGGVFYYRYMQLISSHLKLHFSNLNDSKRNDAWVRIFPLGRSWLWLVCNVEVEVAGMGAETGDGVGEGVMFWDVCMYVWYACTDSKQRLRFFLRCDMHRKETG
jgi:hypothetical protein